MNRHFTETSKQLAKEKAEADAALADLERRRAQTSEFVPSTGGELHPFDSLYVELQQKRADCRRKERETMLLYQRYVHKFQKNKNPPAPSRSPEKQATPPVQEVDEDVSDDEAEFVHKTPQKGGVNVSVDESSTPEAAAPPPSSPPAGPIQDSPVASPSSVQESVEEKKMPDLTDLKAKPSTVPEDKSVQQDEAMEIKPEEPPQEELELPREPAVDTSMLDDYDDAVEAVQSTGEPIEEPALGEDAPPEEEETAATPILNSVSSESFSVNRPTAEVTADFPPGTASEEDSDEDDQRSVISGLTTVNSALTRQVMEQLESEMEFFIKNETEAIQKLLDEEEEGGASVNMSFGGSRLSSDASVAASLKAEQMAEEMQKMLEQFEKDEMSAVSEPKSPGNEHNKTSSSITQSLYPRKYKSPNPNEEWMVYWDEKYEREYFYEKNSKTTQWEAPVMKLGFKDNPDFTPQTLPKRTSKLVVEKRLSRSDIYKKKLRRQRMQRAAVLFVILGSLALSVVHWKVNHAEKTYPDAMKATYIDLKDVYEYTFTNRTAVEQEALEIAKRQEEERKAREAAERDRKRKEAAVAAEAERLRLEKVKAQEEAERKRKAAEEAEKKRKLEAERKAAEEKAAREKRLREEEEARLRAEEEARQRKEEEERLKKEEEERLAEEARLEAARLAKLEEEMKRPWGCHLPFSHVIHGRCRKLAKTNPIYSEKDVLNSFLQ